MTGAAGGEAAGQEQPTKRVTELPGGGGHSDGASGSSLLFDM